jgi:hypothetical protein
MYLYLLSRRTYPCIIFLLLHMYNYAVIDSLGDDRYHEASSCGGFDLEDV